MLKEVKDISCLRGEILPMEEYTDNSGGKHFGEGENVLSRKNLMVEKSNPKNLEPKDESLGSRTNSKQKFKKLNSKVEVLLKSQSSRASESRMVSGGRSRSGSAGKRRN